MAELQGWLLFPCVDLNGPDHLWAYNLATDVTVEVGVLQDYLIANGMVALAPDTLLLANTDILEGNGSIGKLTIDFSQTTPELLSDDSQWGGAADGLGSPNGMRIQDGLLYISDTGFLRVIELDNSLEISSITKLDAPTNPFYDDIDPSFGGGLLATSFFEGRIYRISDNCLAKTDARFLAPSAVRVGRGAFAGQVLVTERGRHRLSTISVAELEALPCL